MIREMKQLRELELILTLKINNTQSRKKVREGNSFAQLGHIVKAMKCFQQATVYDPSNGIAFYNLAIGFVMLKNQIQASKNLNKALELNPRLYKFVDKSPSLKNLICQ